MATYQCFTNCFQNDSVGILPAVGHYNVDCCFALRVAEPVYRVQLNEHIGLVVKVAVSNPVVGGVQKRQIVDVLRLLVTVP